MKIVLGSDHAGFCLRRDLAEYLTETGHDVEEVGADSTEAYDYPDAADIVAGKLLDGTAEYGVLVCGSGIGVDIRANRFPHIRAANCLTSEMAELARLHNHANVLCLGARLLNSKEAREILDKFLTTEGSEEPRHVKRVEKLDRAASCVGDL